MIRSFRARYSSSRLARTLGRTKPTLLVVGAVLGLFCADQPSLHAQTSAPGGIGSGLEYWIRPEEMQATAGILTNWDDVYGLHTNEERNGGGFALSAGFNFTPPRP